MSETTYFIIPCGTAKADSPRPAGELYVSAHWRWVRDSVIAEAEATAAMTGGNTVVLILSALHGLLTLDQIVAPYDLRMGQPGSVTVDTLAAQAQAHGIAYDDDAESYPEVYCFMGADYFRPLDEALRRDDVFAFDAYEAAPGIGYHRGVIGHMNLPIGV